MQISVDEGHALGHVMTPGLDDQIRPGQSADRAMAHVALLDDLAVLRTPVGQDADLLVVQPQLTRGLGGGSGRSRGEWLHQPQEQAAAVVGHRRPGGGDHRRRAASLQARPRSQRLLPERRRGDSHHQTVGAIRQRRHVRDPDTSRRRARIPADPPIDPPPTGPALREPSVYHQPSRRPVRRLRHWRWQISGRQAGHSERGGRDALLAADRRQRPDHDLGRPPGGGPHPCHLADHQLHQSLQG